MNCKNRYILPLKVSDIQAYRTKKEFVQKGKLNDAHFGKLKYSIDFKCDEGTPIYATLAGKVVFVKDDSNAGGDDRKYWNDGNRIAIKHVNNEYTGYEHLKCKGSKVKVGQIVKKGQLIGFSGNTGYSECPHLHFEVFTDPTRDEVEGTTLKVRFAELKGVRKN